MLLYKYSRKQSDACIYFKKNRIFKNEKKTQYIYNLKKNCS